VGDEDVDPRPHLGPWRRHRRRAPSQDEENHRGSQNSADVNPTSLKCPQCGSRHVISNITIRWRQVRGAFLSERGHFCFRCGRPFQPGSNGELAFRTVRVDTVSPAIRSLQATADVIVVRYRNGATEILS